VTYTLGDGDDALALNRLSNGRIALQMTRDGEPSGYVEVSLATLGRVVHQLGIERDDHRQHTQPRGD
jgi:hypothetical protein